MFANNPVYPCAYREHCQSVFKPSTAGGLSLCIQGTFFGYSVNMLPKRFIPVHTGNMAVEDAIERRLAVYPCAYREHEAFSSISLIVQGLSLCIQGTFPNLETELLNLRFIPVHTGNIRLAFKPTAR